jgi:DNA-binding CsgD family transcriptional regulator
MPPDLALQALSFVLHGGTYFPPTAILASQTFSTPTPIEYRQPDLPQEQLLPGPEQQTQAPPLGPEDGPYEPQASLFDDKAVNVQREHGFNGGFNGGFNAARHPAEFTERQYAVLVCLCQGDPNKVIGRKLGMTETTVKVHVREIMRKLGVSNRTQVAIAAAHVCSDGAVELDPADSSMTVRSPIPH